MRGVILYGPPASGKDTVTTALQNLDPSYALFPRLKAGPGRTSGYRMATRSTIDKLRRRGDIIWENERYGAIYVIDRPMQLTHLSSHISVVHLGQTAAIRALTTATPGVRWLTVHLHCPREVAAARIVARGTGDTAARLRAWDDTESPPRPDLTIDTARYSPGEAARLIDRETRRL